MLMVGSETFISGLFCLAGCTEGGGGGGGGGVPPHIASSHREIVFLDRKLNHPAKKCFEQPAEFSYNVFVFGRVEFRFTGINDGILNVHFRGVLCNSGVSSGTPPSHPAPSP